MFTTGTKLLVGAAVLAAVAAVVYGVTQDGALGTLGLASAATALAFLAGVNIYARDCNVSAMDTDAFGSSAAAQRAPAPSMWPLVAAVAGVLLVVGLVTYPVVFVIGIAVLIAALGEWLVEAYSDRASGDTRYNATIRERLAHPLEFPIVAALGLGALIYSFSRIMLYLSKSAGPAAFVVVAALILAVGFLVAFRPALPTGVVAAVAAIGAIGLIAGGVATGLGGEREMHPHETTGGLASAGECGPEETEADHDASRSVAAKSNLAATLTLTEAGTLEATMSGFPNSSNVVQLQASNTSHVRFRNETDEHRRLVLDLGERQVLDKSGAPVEGQTEPNLVCTQLVGKGGSQFMTFIVPGSSASNGPYKFEVPGVDGAEVELVVP